MQQIDAIFCRRRNCILLDGHAGDCSNIISGLIEGVDPVALDAAATHHRRIKLRDSWLQICPRRFRAATLSTVDHEPNIVEAVHQWLRRDDGSSLIALGPVGTGKTWLAVAIAEQAHNSGQSVAITSAATMLGRLRPDGGGDIGDYTRPDVLIVDDIGTEKRSEWTDEIMFTTFDSRWMDCRRTIATSNLTPTKLKTALGDRVYDRLGDDALVLAISGKSRRQGPR
jgi:DNA replication protein DnaC